MDCRRLSLLYRSYVSAGVNGQGRKILEVRKINKNGYSTLCLYLFLSSYYLDSGSRNHKFLVMYLSITKEGSKSS